MQTPEWDSVRFEIKRLEELYQQEYTCSRGIGIKRAFWQCNRKSKCPDNCKAYARQLKKIRAAGDFFGAVQTNMTGYELIEAVLTDELH